MKQYSPLFLILLLASTLNAAEGLFTQTIRGTVTDVVTGHPLIGATVALIDSDPIKGTITNSDGSFALTDVPVGRQSLEVSYIGYLSQRVDNLLLSSAKETVVQVALEESFLTVDEVIVSANADKGGALNEMAMVSARTFSVEETERFAGSLGDPARMVANYAGVMTQNDSRNDIIIRGNSPMGVLWRLEGVEIANPNHFGALGTTGGPVSMINNNLLANSDFLTGAFPAEYGNATAGAFDLNMRSGNNEVTEFTGQIGFNGFEGGIEGPMFKREQGVNPSYQVNYRYSTLDVFHKMGFSVGTGSAIPEYQDLTFLVDVPGTKAGRFKMFGIWGKSYISLGREPEDTTGNSYNLTGTATNFGSNLGIVGVSHTYFLTNNMRFKSTISYQETNALTEVDSANFKQETFFPWYRSDQGEDKISLSSQFRHKVNARNNYSIGFIADAYKTNYNDSVYKESLGRFDKLTNTNGTLNLMRAYAQWQHKFTDQITAYGGVHTQYTNQNDEMVVEPRLSLKWQLDTRHSFSAGFGMHSQLQPKVVYYALSYDSLTRTSSRTNENVKFTRSNHYVLGYNYSIAPDIRLRFETYYQDLYSIPVSHTEPEFSMVNAGDFFGIPFVDSLENTGTGRNYGLELTLEKFLSKNYYFLITASLFDSKYRGYDNNERNTAFNGNYVFNALGGYELRLNEKTMLTFDIKTVWAGGKRYVPIDIAESRDKGEDVRDWKRAYSVRHADYFRTDIRIGLKVNGKKISQEWGLDLQNVTGHKNVFNTEYNANNDEINTIYQQGFLPMMLYRINF